MSMIKRPSVAWSVAGIVLVGMAVGGVLTAQTQSGISAYAGGPVAEPMGDTLPPVPRGPMTVTQDPIKALSVLSFDDGTCESGLGAGTTAFVTDLVDFDVPTQCQQAGLDIVGVTTRMNTGQSIAAFAFGQSGAAPPIVGAVSTTALATAIPAAGPCPATALTSRSVGPGAAVITGTSNFFAGVRAQGFVGRDTNGPPAGRIWLLCGTCGMTQYTPTTLSGLGLGGNWMIRVTVEDQNCLPVELMGFSVE
ncbi:MAG: hypothetical protein GY906_35760 [bacterium]|nr:hypothetical protein [bacterium]